MTDDYTFQVAEEIGFNNKYFEDEKYIAEERLSGCRSLLSVEKEFNRFYVNKPIGKFDKYYEIGNNIIHLKTSDLFSVLGESIFDGMLVAPSENIPLEGYAKVVITSGCIRAEKLQEQYGHLKYVLLDILKFKGTDLRDLPYHERRVYLQLAFNEINQKTNHIKMIDVVTGEKREFYQYVEKKGSNGVVLKNKDSKYEGTKNENFLEIKNKKTRNNLNITQTANWHTIFKNIRTMDFDRKFDFNRYLLVMDLSKGVNERLLVNG